MSRTWEPDLRAGLGVLCQSGVTDAKPSFRRGARGRDWAARLTRQSHSLSQPGRRTWRAISGLARAYSTGRADRRLRRRGKPATAAAGSWKNRAAWNAPNACYAVRASHRRPSNRCIIFKRTFETKFGQESLKNGRLWEPSGANSSGKVSAGFPAGPAQCRLASGKACCLGPAALPPRATLATTVADFPVIAP